MKKKKGTTYNTYVSRNYKLTKYFTKYYVGT